MFTEQTSGFHMTAQALSTMVRYGRNPVIVLIVNGIYGYEQFLISPTFFSNSGESARPYVVLDQWDFVKFANGLHHRFPDETPFDERARENQFDYLAASEHAQASLAEQYVGMPFEA
jgi:TPP-dependent 2-oxoacid decarboxylase